MMKLLEKLKNTFFEEEEYVEVEEPKKEVVARKVEPKEVKKEVKPAPVVEKVEEEVVEEEEIENYLDSELIKKDNKVTYYEDNDFIENDLAYIDSTREEPRKLYGGSIDSLYDSINFSNDSYSNKPYSAPSKEAFKPTPIISPIYGVLDKNYRKEEVIDKKDKPSSYVSRKNADLDSIRKKAYGGLDPLEEMNNNNYKENVVEDEEENNNLLYDMTNDNSKPVVDQVTLADAEEYFEDLGLEYNIDYKDSRYEKATGRRTSSSYEPVDVSDENDSNVDSLEDNLFDLIDSIYEDGDK